MTKYVDDQGRNKKDEVKKCKKIIEKSLPMFESVTKPEIDFVREVGFLPEYASETFKNVKKVCTSLSIKMSSFIVMVLCVTQP